MRHDELYVADLVDSTRAIREYLDGISREHWDEDRVLRDAVLYRLLLLGEIASALPDALLAVGHRWLISSRIYVYVRNVTCVGLIPQATGIAIVTYDFALHGALNLDRLTVGKLGRYR